MATSKPRITISLEPDVYATLKELSELQGRPMSSMVTEMLHVSHPIQQKVLEATRKAFESQSLANQELVSNLSRAQANFDTAIQPLLDLLGSVSEGTPPPHSNTGVTNSNLSPKTPIENASKARPRRSGAQK